MTKWLMTKNERRAWFETKRKEARELVKAGMSREDAAIELGMSTSMVNKACYGLKSRYVKPPRVYHDWLDADDEANVAGFWVPTPAEIEERKLSLLPNAFREFRMRSA